MLKNSAKRYKPVLVSDLGNVIVFFDMKIALARFQNRFNISASKIHEYFSKYDIAAKIDTGELQPEKFHQLFSDRFKIKISYSEFCSFWNEIFTLNAEYIEYLKSLKQSFQFLILSNTNSVHWNYIINKFPVITEIFKVHILSYEEGIKKPDNRIFNRVFELQPDPDKVIFIDDTVENIDAASKIGIHCIRYTEFKKFKTEFDEYALS
ncbi:HAD-IA family hydrolase [bacterium]|nr:HAD-IA family hydrolase [bacterium]